MKTDTLNASEIKRYLGSGEIGCQIYFAEEIDSTNTWAKQLAAEGAPSGSLVCANMQTAGKGRRGRNWASPKGESLCMTLILRPEILPQNASSLTLVMGLSTAQALRNLLGLDVQIKWPNDIVISGKKLCGILTEMSATMTGIDYVIIGVGINVNQMTFSDEIKDIATSAALEKGEYVSRAQIAAEVMKQFEINYHEFLKTSDLSGLREAYDEMMVNRGRVVKVLSPGNEFMGTAVGTNEKGELLVEKDNGEIEAIYAGEVSVRGIYGYV